jgi:hypothetical protein
MVCAICKNQSRDLLKKTAQDSARRERRRNGHRGRRLPREFSSEPPVLPPPSPHRCPCRADSAETPARERGGVNDAGPMVASPLTPSATSPIGGLSPFCDEISKLPPHGTSANSPRSPPRRVTAASTRLEEPGGAAGKRANRRLGIRQPGITAGKTAARP